MRIGIDHQIIKDLKLEKARVSLLPGSKALMKKVSRIPDNGKDDGALEEQIPASR